MRETLAVQLATFGTKLKAVAGAIGFVVKCRAL